MHTSSRISGTSGLQSTSDGTFTPAESAKLIVSARIDLGDFAETYYFREKNNDSALPATLGVAERLGTVATQSPHVEVQHAGRVLLIAVADLLDVVTSRFLRSP